MRLFICIFIAVAMMPHATNAWMWILPAKVDGVIYLDHYGGYCFYNDIGLLYITKKDKNFVTPHLNKLVSLNVTGTYEIMVPGDIRLEKFTISDPAEDAVSNRNQLRLDASLQNNGKASSITLCVTNKGTKAFSLYPGIIDFFAITTGRSDRDRHLSMDVSDGPSTIFGRERIFGWPQRTWQGAYSNDQASFAWSVRGGHEIKDTVVLQPDQNISIIIDLEHVNGESELFFGYKTLRDSSYETSMGINDLVLPVISNPVVIRHKMNLEGIIPLVGGIYCTLIGFGVVAPGKDAEKNVQWRAKFGAFMKIGGPLLAVFGLVELLGLLG